MYRVVADAIGWRVDLAAGGDVRGAFACVCHEVNEVVPPRCGVWSIAVALPAVGFAACYMVAVAGQQWAARN